MFKLVDRLSVGLSKAGLRTVLSNNLANFNTPVLSVPAWWTTVVARELARAELACAGPAKHLPGLAGGVFRSFRWCRTPATMRTGNSVDVDREQVLLLENQLYESNRCVSRKLGQLRSVIGEEEADERL